MKLLHFCFAALALLLISLGCGGNCSDVHVRAVCIEKQRALYYGIAIYAGDHDGAYPLTGTWQDRIQLYAGLPDSAFVCPQIEPMGPNLYGIAFNTHLAGIYASTITDPASYSCFFDTAILTRNAESSASTLPIPVRHGGNVIFRLDGAAVQIPPPN